MNKNKPFIKVEHDLLDNQVLTPTQKCLLLLLRRLRTAPNGCTPSHTYLMKRTALKDKRTLLRNLDRLQLLGYITWLHRGKNKTNQYFFRGDKQFDQILIKNLRLRQKMSQSHKELYKDRQLIEGLQTEKVILMDVHKKL